MVDGGLGLPLGVGPQMKVVVEHGRLLSRETVGGGCASAGPTDEGDPVADGGLDDHHPLVLGQVVVEFPKSDGVG